MGEPIKRAHQYASSEAVVRAYDRLGLDREAEERARDNDLGAMRANLEVTIATKGEGPAFRALLQALASFICRDLILIGLAKALDDAGLKKSIWEDPKEKARGEYLSFRETL